MEPTKDGTKLDAESTDHAPFRPELGETLTTNVAADAGADAHVSRLREILDEIYHVGGLQYLVGEAHELLTRLHGPRPA